MTAFSFRSFNACRGRRAAGQTVAAALVASALALACSTPGEAQTQPQTTAQAMRIAAVVNDDVISVYDIQARLSLVIATSALEDHPTVRKQLMPDILRGLIDDHLKMQEAKRLGLHVTEEDTNRALDSIEKGNRMPPGGLEDFLAQRRIAKPVLVNQITAEIAWAKVINRAIRPTITVPDDEIDNINDEIKANRGKPEYKVSEIFLPVDDPGNAGTTEGVAQKLLDELKSGADFEQLARSCS